MQVCERDPSLILDVVHHTSQEERGRGGYHPLPNSDSPDWCVCGRCREMPSEEERECCRQTPVNCISSQPVIFFSNYEVHKKNMIKYVLRCSSNLPNMLSFQDFDFIVLDPLVLLVARRYRQVLIRCYTAWASKMWARHDNVNTAKLFMYIYILYSIVTSTLFFIIDRIS